MNRQLSLVCCGLMLLAVSCSPMPGPDKTVAGAILGASWGAGAGAVIGHQTGNVGPGVAIGAGFGALAGLMHGIGLDVAEGHDLKQQRQIDSLRVQTAATERHLASLRDSLDNRDRKLSQIPISERIFFDEGRASLRLGSATQLERLSRSIKVNPYVGTIEVHGHSADFGDTEKNFALSEARARTVATFLVEHGISLDRIRMFSHGGTQPLASNANQEGRQLNRRVEVVLLK